MAEDVNFNAINVVQKKLAGVDRLSDDVSVVSVTRSINPYATDFVELAKWKVKEAEFRPFPLARTTPGSG